jgi:hypothetical protein
VQHPTVASVCGIMMFSSSGKSALSLLINRACREDHGSPAGAFQKLPSVAHAESKHDRWNCSGCYGDTSGVNFCRTKLGDSTVTKRITSAKSCNQGLWSGSRKAKGLRIRRALSHHLPQRENVLRSRLNVRLQVVWKATPHLFAHSPVPCLFLATVGAMAQTATTLEVFAAHAAYI